MYRFCRGTSCRMGFWDFLIMIFLCNVFVYQSVYKMSCSIGGYVESKKKDKVFEKKNG